MKIYGGKDFTSFFSTSRNIETASTFLSGPEKLSQHRKGVYRRLSTAIYNRAKPLIIDKVLLAGTGISGTAGANRLTDMQSRL